MAKLEKQSASPPPGQIKHDEHHIGTLQDSSFMANGPGTADDELYFGDGNHPTNFNISTDSKTGIELGLKIHYRTGDDITASSVDSDGTAHYIVPDGKQVVDPAHNVSADAPNRAAWSFDYSVNSGDHNLDEFDYRIIIKSGDGEVGTYDRVRLDATHTIWVDTAHDSGFGDDDGGNAHLAQNSVNLGFNSFALFGTDRFDAGETYDITLQAFDHGKIVAQVHDALVLA